MERFNSLICCSPPGFYHETRWAEMCVGGGGGGWLDNGDPVGSLADDTEAGCRGVGCKKTYGVRWGEL